MSPASGYNTLTYHSGHISCLDILVGLLSWRQDLVASGPLGGDRKVKG